MSPVLHGAGVSDGSAAGPVARLRTPPPPPVAPAADGSRRQPAIDVPAELARVDEALAAVTEELDQLRRRAGANSAVLSAQARITRDPALSGLISELVRARRNAPRAVFEAFAAYRDMRAADPMRPVPPEAELDDVRDRTVARLLGEAKPGVPDPGRPFVLVARDLTPSVTATLDPQRVLALVTERGGPTSHSAVLAKSLGLPAVVACAGASMLVDGQTVVVDGRAGTVTTEPEERLVADVRRRSDGRRAPSDDHGPGRTADGRSVPLHVAIGGPADVADALAVGAEGVGVFRTEFCFLGRDEAPGVRQQTTAYAEVLRAFAGKPVTLRTLDIGADKPLPFVPLGEQPNPALGIRGLRLARRDPDLLTGQLRAIARAGEQTGCDVRVMAPMVATPGEGAWFAAQAHSCGLAQAGAMVEIPAAALAARELLQAVDFLSVGTNDLAQYAFAADRAAGELADLLDFWHPALLRLVRMTIVAGEEAGRPVMVCGEAASDPMLAPVLVGLGAAGLSMDARSLPQVRSALAARTDEECAQLAELAIGAASPEEGRAAVTARVRA